MGVLWRSCARLTSIGLWPSARTSRQCWAAPGRCEGHPRIAAQAHLLQAALPAVEEGPPTRAALIDHQVQPVPVGMAPFLREGHDGSRAELLAFEWHALPQCLPQHQGRIVGLRRSERNNPRPKRKQCAGKGVVSGRPRTHGAAERRLRKSAENLALNRPSEACVSGRDLATPVSLRRPTWARTPTPPRPSPASLRARSTVSSLFQAPGSTGSPGDRASR